MIPAPAAKHAPRLPKTRGTDSACIGEGQRTFPVARVFEYTRGRRMQYQTHALVREVRYLISRLVSHRKHRKVISTRSRDGLSIRGANSHSRRKWISTDAFANSQLMKAVRVRRRGPTFATSDGARLSIRETTTPTDARGETF